MTDNCKKLFDLLSELPPDLNKIEAFVVDNKLTSKEVTIALFEFIDDNKYEDWEIDIDTPIIRDAIPLDCHLRYLYQLTELLLKHGLDPNMIYDSTTLPKALQYLVIPYVAADVMQLLLDNGADIGIITEGENVFQEVDDELVYRALDTVDWDDDFQLDENFYKNYLNSTVHLWFVLVSAKDDSLPYVTTYDGFSLKELKNHRLYDFCISHTENKMRWEMRIFDIITKREVAMVK